MPLCRRLCRSWVLYCLLVSFSLFYVVIFLLATSYEDPTAPPDTARSAAERERRRRLRTERCGDLHSPVDLLILVQSDVSEVAARNTIRATYGGFQRVAGGLHADTLFILDGSAEVADGEMRELLSEMDAFRDVTFTNSSTSENNLTASSVANRWIESCVGSSRYVLFTRSPRELHLHALARDLALLNGGPPASAIPGGSASEGVKAINAGDSDVFLADSELLRSHLEAIDMHWGSALIQEHESLISVVSAAEDQSDTQLILRNFIGVALDSPENLALAKSRWDKSQRDPSNHQKWPPVFEAMQFLDKSKPVPYFRSKKCNMDVVHTGHGPINEVLLLIESLPGNSSLRSTIRQTLGSVKDSIPGFSFHLRFLVQLQSYILFKDSETRAIEEEEQAHHDILAYHRDSAYEVFYENRTSGLRLGLNWAAANCSAISYLVLAAEDTFLNPFALTAALKDIEPGQPEVWGYVRHTSLPVRRFNQPYYVPRTAYPEMIYPPFPDIHSAAILTRAAVRSIAGRRLSVHDVGMTDVNLGIYAKIAQIPVLAHPHTDNTPGCPLTRCIAQPRVDHPLTAFPKLWAQARANRHTPLPPIETRHINDTRSNASLHFSPTLLQPRTHPCFSLEGEERRVDLLVLVTTAPNNSWLRIALRSSWAKTTNANHCNIATVFLLGRPVGSESQRRIEEESALYGDIIQFDFTDSYRNASAKTINGIHWAASSCPHAKYVYKVDDDTFANPFGLSYYLSHFAPAERLYLGHVNKASRPLRKLEKGMPGFYSKWLVSRQEYPVDTYPPYALGGPGYVLSMDVARDLRDTARTVPLFVFEDAYIGILNTRVKVNPVSHYLFYNYALDNNKCDCHKYYASHYQNATQIFSNWRHLFAPVVSCHHAPCL